MSTRAAPPEPAAPVAAGATATRGRLLLGLGAAALLLSLLLGWDGGIRDQLSAADVATARRNGVLSAFDTEPSTPFALLVPFGFALLAVAALSITVAVRGVASRADPVVLAAALVCTLSLTVRGLLDGTPGVPDGSLLATGGLLVALPAATMLPARGQGPHWSVLALGVVCALLLTGLVHDAYAVVDTDEAVLGSFGLPDGTPWPESWLGAAVGPRTLVDAGYIAVASLGLLAAALGAARRFERPAALGLVAFAALVLAGALVLAVGTNPGVSGVDRFPWAGGAMAALLATMVLAPRAAAAASAALPEPPEPSASVPPVRAPEPRDERVAPPEAWAHPSKRPRGWWS